MLEIPESRTISKQLNDTIQGKVIANVKANDSPHKFAWYFGDPEEYHNLLVGKQIGDSIARAGMVEIKAEDCRILLCDGANLKYYEDSNKAPKKHQLYIEFEDDSALVASIQMYGGIWAYKEGQNDNPYYTNACKRPSPLSDTFDYNYFCSLKNPSLENKSVKAFLATEQRIPGLGNGVLQDILYQAGLHPKRKLYTISEVEFEKLYHSIKDVLNEMVNQGGRDTEKDLYGNPGGYMTYLSKKTYLTPCPKCGYEIHKEAFLGGTIYYCDHCQI